MKSKKIKQKRRKWNEIEGNEMILKEINWIGWKWNGNEMESMEELYEMKEEMKWNEREGNEVKSKGMKWNENGWNESEGNEIK